MLEKIFIKNYLSIYAEQELKITNRITTLIGENAVGKTTVLKAINKLNGIKILQEEKNINHKNEESKIYAKFRFTKELIKKLNKNHESKDENNILKLPTSNELIYTLIVNDQGELSYSLSYDVSNDDFDLDKYLFDMVIKHIQKQINGINNEELIKKISSYFGSIDSIKKIITDLTDDEKEIIGSENIQVIEHSVKELENYSDNLLPNYHFIYMNSFKDILVDDISVDEVDNNQTVKNFLNIVGIEISEIKEAIDNNDSQKITSLSNKVVSIATEHFKKIFSQVESDDKFKISMTINNKDRKLNFWIQNKITGDSVIKFSEESEGTQWYLSMYLKLYEYFQKTNDSDLYFLLLDEPNIYLHAKAQKDLLDIVFRKNLHDIQTIYSTHSPYMIDGDDLYSLRIIDRKDQTYIYNTTIDYLKSIKKTMKMKDIDVLSPVLIATGITISNQLTIANADQIVVVEGPHDYYMLKAMQEVLKYENNKLKIIPCQGASKVPFMCGYLYGLGYRVLAIFDNDDDGIKAIETLKYENEDLKFINAFSYSKKDNNDSEQICLLEDLFSESDRKKFMEEKSTVNYRHIYDIRNTISFDQETKNNFLEIFNKIDKFFKKKN